MLIKAAINGGRTKADHAAVPVSPLELAADVVNCLNAGAGAIHLHVRSTSIDDGLDSEKESLDAEEVARTLLAVRPVAPGARIGISTGAWILPDPTARLRALERWRVLPDFASVNFSEDGAAEVATLLLSRGVDVEAGLSDPSAAKVFLNSGLVSRCFRVLLEPQEQDLEMLSFLLGSEEYVVAVDRVREVLTPREITPVPHAANYLLGVCSLRGIVMPIIDLNRRLGLATSERDEKSRIIVVSLGHDDQVGLFVDRVRGVVRFTQSSVQPAPDTVEQGAGAEFLKGIARKNDRLYILLDVEKAIGS